ncbi:MAG: 4Fe-4S binding protein, partial [Duncaniella sp.]|nr:4Fe-4S binding protein [Duncaniella sp.]
MLKLLRQILAVVSIVMVTLLFVDFTGIAHHWFGWIAKIQFLPAVLALNIAVVIGLIVLTLLLGRVYCSVICPLGIFQDAIAWLGKLVKKNRYSYSAAKNMMRYIFLGLIVVGIVFGIHVIVALLAPYSAYGRIAQSLVSPAWIWVNNYLAEKAADADSYTFYNVDLWLKGGVTLTVAIATVVILAVLAWRNGRTYCNTVCPVGTVLGFLSRYALLRPVIDTSKCNGCGLCARNCKSACIDSKTHTIDYSRCVDCMDCIGKCHKHAISYTWHREAMKQADEKDGSVDNGRRQFLAVTSIIATTAAVKAQEKTTDGGLAIILDKKAPSRHTRIVPAGAQSLRNLSDHCTACQLCVAACPNGVLRPSSDLATLMQPESSYERGYCRPECTRCSEVCPTGAIRLIDEMDKASTQI